MTGTIENIVPTDMIFKIGNHYKFLWVSSMKYNLFIDSIVLDKHDNIYVKVLKAHLTDYGEKFPIQGVLRPYGLTTKGKTRTKMHFIIPKLNLQGITTGFDEDKMLTAEIYKDKRMLDDITSDFQVQNPTKKDKIEYVGFIPITKF